jgi:hypothetical protein
MARGCAGWSCSRWVCSASAVTTVSARSSSSSSGRNRAISLVVPSTLVWARTPGVVAAAAQGLAVDLDPLPPRRPDRRRRLGGRWGGRWSTATAARRRRASPTSTPTAPWRRCPDRTEVKRGSLSCVIVRPRAIELQGATAAHLARAMGAEPDRAARGSGTADQAGPLDGNHQRAMATDHSRDQLRPTCRSRQTITSRRAAKVCSASDSACRGGFGGSLMSLRRARRWRWGLRPGPDRLPGSSRRW